MLNYKFTQSCVIDNTEFHKGDIIAPGQWIDFFGEVMTTTDEKETVVLKKTSKVAVEKVAVEENAQSQKADVSTPLSPESVNLSKMNKDELISHAKDLGCDVTAEDTKATLTEKIENAQSQKAQ